MKKIAVLGGGESGCGSAVLARRRGMDVFLSDSGGIAPRYRIMLEAEGIPFEEGGHTLERILSASEVVKSPGIPETAPVVRAVREKGIPVVSEIEFAGRYCNGRTVCITGSNGKTTTATLTHSIMQAAGIDAALCGKIGSSFAHSVAEERHDWYVIELSSFQLDGMYDFRADIAVLTNITPDHLDRYDHRLENYAASKMRVIRNQGPGQTFIYSADDPLTVNMLEGTDLKMKALSFSTADRADTAAAISDGRLTIRADGKALSVDPQRLRIKGLHNIRNAEAAALAALEAGACPFVTEEALYEFSGVEHRMEFVAETDGVEWINDSKATNVDSVWYALESMRRPTIWIAGGTDKGNDYGPLKALAREKVKALVCMGLDNSKLVREFTGTVARIYDTRSLDEAIAACRGEAAAGDTVLLSPACASFDLFSNYEDRGRQFKSKVLEKK